MKRLILIVVLIFFTCIVVQAQYVKVLGQAERSARATTSGTSSTNTASITYPLSTITIYNAGTTTPASIFSTSTGTVKANPFTADSAAIYDFFIASGAAFDVRVSGVSNGVAITPFTRAGYTAPGTLGTSLALCGGTADTSLLSALNALGGTIEIPKSITCASNTQTISAALQVDNGGLLKPLTGQTVTLTGPQIGGAWQRFTNALSGQGTISFTGNVALSQVHVAWWGCIPGVSATTQMSAAQRAVDTGIPVIFASTVGGTSYSLDNSTTPLLLNNATTLTAALIGAGLDKTIITFTSTANAKIKIDYPDSGNPSVLIKDMHIRGAAGATPSFISGDYGIYIPGGTGRVISNLVIENVTIDRMGDNAIRVQGGTGPVRIVNAVIYAIGDYGIKVTSDSNASCPQDAAVVGGSIHTSKGGISIDGGTSTVESLTIHDIDIELRDEQTKPALFLKNTFGGVYAGLTVSSSTASLSVGDANVYCDTGASGNTFVGFYNYAVGGLNNYNFLNGAARNTIIGGYHVNSATPPAGLGYLVKSAELYNKIDAPHWAPSTFAANHALGYDATGSGGGIQPFGIKVIREPGTGNEIVWQSELLIAAKNGVSYGAVTLATLVSDAKGFTIDGVLTGDIVKVYSRIGPAEWFYTGYVSASDTVTVSVFNARSGSLTATPVLDIYVYRPVP